MAPLLAGRYELGSRLGVGGMAEVVRGMDVRLQRPVAVKLIMADRVDAATRERFRREARASAGFSHPHAVATYDAGEDAGWLYLVMELVEGRTLAEHLAAVGRLGPDDAVTTIGAVLDALGAAHDAGLVHRDVKPGNVLLGANGTVKLADFGIARRFDEVGHDLTATGTFVGTARYASPEQLAGKQATGASDIYSTGVVLYEMLAGRPPFDGDSPVAIALAQQHDPVADVRVVAAGVPRGVADAIRRALARDPVDRFESARAMRAALIPRTAVAPAALPIGPTQVATTPLGPAPIDASGPVAAGRRRWWWLAVPVMLALVVGTLVGVLDDRSPETGSATTPPPVSAPAATATVPAPAPPAPAPAPTVPPTTAPTSTTPSTTAASAVAVPASVGELASLIAADADRFGRKAGDVVEGLEQINGRGNDDARRARQLLERTSGWVDDGQLDPVVLELMQPLLAPLAADDGEGDDEDD